MRLHRFCIGSPLETGTRMVDDETIVHQMTKVLRLNIGDEVIVMDGKGQEAHATITRLEKKSLTLTVDEVTIAKTESTKQVTLCCSVLKRENFEWVVQKATEIGVVRIIPLLSARTVKTNLNVERLKRIVMEAAEQSGRGVIPTITEPQTLKQAWQATEKSTHLFFHTKTEKKPANIANDGAVTCWVGPEGGWSDDEEAFAKEQGMTTLSLGPLTLRAETAAVVASYVAIHGLDLA